MIYNIINFPSNLVHCFKYTTTKYTNIMSARDFIAIMVNASTNIGSAMEMMTAVITVTN